jgi:hypothetical protein
MWPVINRIILVVWPKFSLKNWTEKCNASICMYGQTWVNDHFLITTTCLQWPLFWGPNFNFHIVKLPLNNDHLSTTATNFGSQGWSLYISLTVLLVLFHEQKTTNNEDQLLCLSAVYMFKAWTIKKLNEISAQVSVLVPVSVHVRIWFRFKNFNSSFDPVPVDH